MNALVRQYALPLSLAPDLSEAGFLHAPCNEAAAAWLRRTPDWPQGRLALWGEPGVGKSHLLAIWARRLGGEVAPGPGLRFAGHLPAALAVDDADLAPERDLLHVLNDMAAHARPVLLAARAAPARWAVALPDLASRLRAVVAVEIMAPDDVLLRALLARLLAARQVRVAEDIQDWLRLRLPRTQAAMHDAARLLDRLSLGRRSPVTWGIARQVCAILTEAADGAEERAFPNAPGLF